MRGWPSLPFGLLVLLALGGCADRVATTAPRQYSVRVAEAALDSGAPDMAQRVAEIILDRDPRNVPALIASGNAQYAMGRFTSARAAYRAALELDPQASAAHVGIGRILVHGDPRAAEAEFLAALATDPRNTAALNNLGITRNLLGQRAGAEAAFRQALAVAPGMDDVTINLGMTLALAGQSDAAAQLLRPLLAHAGLKPAWRTDLAAALAMAGDRTAARDALDGNIALADNIEVPPLAHASLPAAPETPAVIARAPRIAVERSDLAALPSFPVAMNGQGATPPPETPPPAGFQIQLAALDDEALALARREHLLAHPPAPLAGHAPTVERALLNGRTYWRLRAGGYVTRAQASSACRQLRKAGNDCWVI